MRISQQIRNLVQCALPYLSCGALCILIACANAVPDPPPTHVAVDDSGFSVNAGESIDLSVLSNDLPSGMTSLNGISRQPTKGSAVQVGNSIRYTANLTSSGPDSFQYQSSSSGGSGVATVSLTINPVVTPDPPTVGSDSYTVLRRSQTRLNVLDNDNGHGQQLTITNLNAPGGIDNGERNLSVFQDTVTYNAYGGQGTGSDSFTYTASNGATSAQGQVSITILPWAYATLINNSGSRATFSVGIYTRTVQPNGTDNMEFSPAASGVRSPRFGGATAITIAPGTTVRVTATQPTIVGPNNQGVFEASSQINENAHVIFRFEEFPVPQVFVEASPNN